MELIKDSVDYIIFAILGLMGFVTVWLTIERLLFLRSVQPSGYADKDSYDKALTDNLTTLYIIYSNAPYVGLLGTVIGIMITFYDMGQSGNINALGLAVAIPTLVIYNGLQRRINVLSAQWKDAAK